MSFRRAALLALAVLLPAPFATRGADPGMAVRPQDGNRIVTVEKTDEAGVLSGTMTEITSARVRSVDFGKREVTLHVSDGKVEVVKVGPEVKNLEKLDRGDRVQLKFRGGLVLRRLAPGDAGAAPEVSKETKGTGIGDVLGGVETVRGHFPGTVSAVDAATRVFTITAKDGKPFSARAGTSVPLDDIRTGDRFAVTFSAALAVSVEPTYEPQR
ncbi:MAG: hypothetical protein WB493_05535 [Anaeromyxobacteraceae bacterium]